MNCKRSKALVVERGESREVKANQPGLSDTI